jgi:hypothetical protein
MDAPATPLLVAPLPMAFSFPLAELMLGVVVAPLGAIIPIVIKT